MKAYNQTDEFRTVQYEVPDNLRQAYQAAPRLGWVALMATQASEHGSW
jgi:hypothetical protein